MKKKIPGAEKNPNFWASGISVVMHMNNPYVPAIHFNTRFIYTTHGWFGGGMDVTPCIVDNKEKTFKEQIKWIKKILDKYKNKKGIIHTVNYEITEWVKENVDDERLLFHDTSNRQEILDKHLYSKEPTVLVSPSMMSGVDLKDDLARFQILLKIPYPNISSQKIKSRNKTNKNWYQFKTCVDIIQSYGRAVRSNEDYADFYILDSNFSDVVKYSSHYLPEYLQSAIKTLNI
jgi:Rad3-related DNA helicase